jgi:hypothetical protein
MCNLYSIIATRKDCYSAIGSPHVSYRSQVQMGGLMTKAHRILLAATALLMATASPIYAADLSCSQWLAYRTGDKSLAGQGLIFTTFLQGYIDGINEFSDLFNGNLITETSPGKFAPTPPTRHLTIENTVAVLDRQCTANPAQSAHVVGVNEVNAQMQTSANPIMATLALLLTNLNKAKGYK